MEASTSSRARFATFAWGVLAYDLAAVAWGAYVRASGSGAGCGQHWPLCNGEVIPRAPKLATLIELSHRVTAGIAVTLALIMAVWAIFVFPRGNLARRAALTSFALGVAEAAIGAGLVRYQLVAHDESGKRALSMSFHLMNTFFFLAAVAVSAFAASGFATKLRFRGKSGQFTTSLIAFVALTSMIILGTSGAIAALGDTLFPVQSLREGFTQDLSPTTHLFVRLRIFHPFIATASGALVIAATVALRLLRPTPLVRNLTRAVAIAFVAQYFIGLANVALLAPIPVQLIHLLGADAVWLLLVLASAAALDERAFALASTSAEGLAQHPHSPHPPSPQGPQDGSDGTAAAA